MIYFFSQMFWGVLKLLGICCLGIWKCYPGQLWFFQIKRSSCCHGFKLFSENKFNNVTITMNSFWKQTLLSIPKVSITSDDAIKGFCEALCLLSCWWCFGEYSMVIVLAKIIELYSQFQYNLWQNTQENVIFTIQIQLILLNLDLHVKKLFRALEHKCICLSFALF